MLLALQDKSMFASFKFWSDLVMVGQSKLMPGQMPGYARANARVCPGLATPLLTIVSYNIAIAIANNDL